jgi:hypothetical protein
MARRLLAAGYNLQVYHRSGQRAQAEPGPRVWGQEGCMCRCVPMGASILPPGLWPARPDAARERARPLFQVLGQDVFDFGENPAPAPIIMDAIAEALVLAENAHRSYRRSFPVVRSPRGMARPLPRSCRSDGLYTRLLTSVACGRAEMDEVSFTLLPS